jgi:seryl-tRNA synthetase
MLEISKIREHKEEILARLSKRANADYSQIIEDIIMLDEQRRAAQGQLDQVLAESNHLAVAIGDLFKAGKASEAGDMKAKTALLKEQSQVLKDQLTRAEDQMRAKLYLVPNAPGTSVSKGKTPEENDVVRSGGVMPNLTEDAKPHWEITSKYQLIDFELGVKITGAGFPVYTGKGARLQRALINFFLDEATAAGYSETQPPLLVNEASGIGTGQLPDKEGQMYHAQIDDLYLIPTAEVPLTNLYRDVILNESDFPVKICGYTPCFRREAGSYGKDVRGLNRLHQFDKVEIVQLIQPEHSYNALEKMVLHVEGLLQKLELPYRVLRLCGGDMGFASAMTYDMEVYSAAQKKWLEVSSISNFETFQSNRLKLRYRSALDKKITLAHTLNGSALALPRIVAALLENNQTESGIIIPKALVPYTGFDKID